MKLRIKVQIILNPEETERNLRLLEQLETVGVRELGDDDRQFIQDMTEIHERAHKACKA